MSGKVEDTRNGIEVGATSNRIRKENLPFVEVLLSALGVSLADTPSSGTIILT